MINIIENPEVKKDSKQIPMSYNDLINYENIFDDNRAEQQNQEQVFQCIQLECAKNEAIKEYSKSFQHDLEKRKSAITIHIPLIANELYVAIEFEINFQKNSIISVGRLCEKFGMPYFVIQKNLRIQFCRYFLRLNAVQKFGAFYISPKQGDICFKINQQFNTSAPDWIKQDLLKNIEIAFQMIEQRFRGQMYRFLITLNKTDIYAYKKMEEYQEEQKINMNLKQFIPNALELLESIKMIAEEQCTTTFTPELLYQHQAIFNIQKTTHQIKLYNSIVFQENSVAKKMNEGISGGFASVYKTEISFQDADIKINNFMKRTVAMKQAKTQTNSIKIKHEINIMKYLSQFGSSPFIAQCYHNDAEQDTFYMEYYQHSSLDMFRQKFEQILSLNTKLFLLYNIGMGIKFLHDNKVIHMDLKPQNIFISKSFIAKLGDFGEAKQLDCISPWPSGKTYPYCAPEGTGNASTNYDIYSFGLIIIELIFERIPIDFQVRNLDNLIKNYDNMNQKFQYNPHYIKKYPQKLFEYLYLIAYKCLNPIQEQRPKIEWIIIAIRKAIQYIDKVY